MKRNEDHRIHRSASNQRNVMIYSIVALGALGAILGTVWMWAVKTSIESLKKRVKLLEFDIKKEFPPFYEHPTGSCCCGIKIKNWDGDEGFVVNSFNIDKIFNRAAFQKKHKKILHSFTFDDKEYKVLQPGEKTLDLPTAMKWAKANIESRFKPLYETKREDGGILGKRIILPKKEWIKTSSGEWNKGWNIYVESDIEKACLRFVNEVLTRHLK